MGWLFGHRDEWEPYEPDQNTLNEFGMFPDDEEDACCCDGGEDLPHFPVDGREATFDRRMFRIMHAGFVVLGVLGLLLIWKPLLGSPVGVVFALLGTAWFSVVFRGVRARTIERYFWGPYGFEAECEYLLNEIAD